MDKVIKEKAYTIRGLAILAIILCHTPTIIANHCHADLAVSIFFFLTGYFVMNNYLNKKKYLDKNFIIRKIYNIYIPFVISNIIYILTYIIVYKHYCFNNILDLILKIIGIIPVNGFLWYVAHVLMYYIIFYFFYHKTKNKSISFYLLTYMTYLLIVFGLCACFRIWGGCVLFEHLLLAIGGLCAIIINKKENIKLYSNKNKIILCILFIIIFIYSLYQNNLLIIITLQVMIPFFSLIVFKYNKVLDFIGKNSLLLYIYHIQIIMVMNQYKIINNELLYILVFLIANISIIVVWEIIKRISNKKEK